MPSNTYFTMQEKIKLVLNNQYTEKIMISDLNQSILYTCAECSKSSTHKINVFDFPKNKTIELLCANKKCNSNVISIKLHKDKYKILITCPVCEDVHTYNITSRTFWNKDFFIFKCPQSDLGILYVGKDQNRLKRELSAQSEIIADILATECSNVLNLDLLMQILSRLDELLQNNAISCSCKSKDITFDTINDGIIISCKLCKKSKTYLFNHEFLNYILSINTLTI